jgi:serine phosphatase RsbU (regulator of sigma subunit)
MSELKTKHSSLDSFDRTRVRSERYRSICMLVVFGAFVLLGVWRTIIPLVEFDARVGPILLGIATGYLVFEVIMLRIANLALRQGRRLNPKLWLLHGIAECLFPVITMGAILLVDDDNVYTLLVSPGYAFLFLLIALSILHLEPRSSVLTGIVGTLGYSILVGYVLTHPDRFGPNPHPRTLYITLALMLVLATGAIAFIAGQVKGFVASAVREVEVRRENDRLQRDMDIARQIQLNLLPATMPDLTGFDMAAMSRSADQTGGDYYDWRYLEDQRAVITIADVTGHGIGPALVTAACRAYVRAVVTEHADPAVIIDRVNRLLTEDMAQGNFVTFAMLDLDAKTNTGHFLAAGHGPTFFVHGSTGEISSIGAHGLPLGIIEEQKLDEAVKFDFEPGDLVVLVSDGFFEWANEAGEQFGLDRLSQTICDHCQKSADDLIEQMDLAIGQFVDGRPQDDDMTAVVIKRKSAGSDGAG